MLRDLEGCLKSCWRGWGTGWWFLMEFIQISWPWWPWLFFKHLEDGDRGKWDRGWGERANRARKLWWKPQLASTSWPFCCIYGHFLEGMQDYQREGMPQKPSDPSLLLGPLQRCSSQTMGQGRILPWSWQNSSLSQTEKNRQKIEYRRIRSYPNTLW
jgi:hypothetical protein